MSRPARSLALTARLLREGRLSCEEHARDILDRCAEHASCNAFVTLDADRLLTAARAADRADPAARRPLHGIPLAVKDNIDVALLPTTAGTPALSRHRPGRSAEVWRRLAGAGALALGKTGMHELAYGVTGQNAAFGTVGNPVVPGHICGGSSSGTAAAVAAGLAPAGLGTDTGGSVRIPAALCGLVGMRPTTGRYPAAGVLRISRTRDTVGVVATDLADVAFLDGLLAADPAERYAYPRAPLLPDGRIRLLLPGPAWTGLDPRVAAVTAGCLRELRSAGADLVQVDLPDSADLLGEAALPVPLHETWHELAFYLARCETCRDPGELIRRIASPDVADVLAPLLHGPVVPAERYRHALRVQDDLADAAAGLLREHRADAFLSPTTILPAAPADVGAEVSVLDRPEPVFLSYIRNTAFAAVMGWPSISLPAGTTPEGLPVGLLLDTPPHTDRFLLALAARCARTWRSSAEPAGGPAHHDP
ncbi:amidase family protein [Nonomuraea sp. NPDC001831]|uniref:amidase family protein n=1 Tax=Nonomuraea sp. NPDC001831 TaxID=3364340 RepID=UPI0036CE26BA